MKRSHFAFGLTVAIALSTGTALVEHPASPDQAPGAYSDITIAEVDNQKAPQSDDDKQVAPSPQSANDSSAKGEDVSVDRDPAPRIPKVEKPEG